MHFDVEVRTPISPAGSHHIFDVTGFQSFRNMPRQPNGHWMKAILHPSDGQIDLILYSDFGTFGHRWENPGEKKDLLGWAIFLSEIHKTQFLSEITNGEHLEFDAEASLLLAQEKIASARREGHLDRQAARILWDSLPAADEDSSADFVMGAISKMSFFGTEAYNDLHVAGIKRNLMDFWNKLWEPFIFAICSSLKAAQYRETIEWMKAVETAHSNSALIQRMLHPS